MTQQKGDSHLTKTYVNFIAAGLALVGIIMNLFQGFITVPFLGNAGLFDIVNFAWDNSKLFGDLFAGPDKTKIIAGLIFLASVPVIAMTGAIRAALRKGGWLLLTVAAIQCVLFAVFLKLVISKTGEELGDNASLLASLAVNSLVPVVWALIYALAAVMASGKKIMKISLPDIGRHAKTPTKSAQTQVRPVSMNMNVNPSKYTAPNGKDYEAMTLRVLIKEGLASLSEARFDDADKYFEHALIRNPESSNAYMGRLMAKYQARDANELVAAPVLLETEEFFQRALMFSSPRMRELLDTYRHVNRQKRG